MPDSFGWLEIGIGVLLIVFNGAASKSCIRSQNQFWGLTFGKKSEVVGRCVFVVCGISAIVLGFLG
jgi:hypothetical protein